jgi:two-component system chemotaxis response regulator CheY
MVPAQSVLIIDDDAVNRRLAHVMFQKLGWQVATLDRGDRALVHLATSPYDLVLLDISMPGMNGEEVCRQIRADPCLREVRVIAYTAHVLLEEQQRFLAGGFDALLLKPISFRAVQELIRAQAPCLEPETLQNRSAGQGGPHVLPLACPP